MVRGLQQYLVLAREMAKGTVDRLGEDMQGMGLMTEQ